MPVERGGRGHCAVCESEQQAEIEEQLADGTSKVKVAARFGISRRSLTRHQTAHLNPALEGLGQAAKSRNPDLAGFRRLFRLYDERARLQAALADLGPEALTQAGPGGWN